MNIGDKVTYITLAPYKKERGIVKGLSSEGYVFVVYHCDNNWDRYFDSPAARTDMTDLVEGWDE